MVSLAAAAAAAALACPHPFMPLGAGTTWTYRVADAREVTLTVKSVVERAGWRIATVDSDEGEERIAEVSFTCSPDGLDLQIAAAFSGATETLRSEGVALLPAAKLADGASWTSSRTSSSGRTLFDHVAAGLEDVTVKAGPFHALRVDVTARGKASTGAAHLWFAKGVGLVKLAVDGGPGAELVRYDVKDEQ
jgi:hypothetical protein